MSFITKHDSLTVHTLLTQEGRKRLANGDLKIKRIAFSDAEVNYGYGFNSNDTYPSYSSITYVPFNNIVSSPYRRSGTVSMNFDGTPPFELGEHDVFGITETVVEPVASLGFYSSITNSNVMSDYRINTDLAICTGYTDTVYFNGTFNLPFGRSPNFSVFNLSGATVEPPEEGLLFIQFINPVSSNISDMNGQNFGRYANFYRYTYTAGTYVINVDRALPRYESNFVPKRQPIWFFPLSGYSNYYGSGTTEPCPIWNMNILHKTQNIGHPRGGLNPTIDSTYVDINAPLNLAENQYGSKSISGVIRSLGLDNLTKCGVLHYSNSYSGSVYGDSFEPRETIVDIPYILWHRNGNGIAGLSTRGGLKLMDADSDVYYDVTGKTSYTILKDGTGPSAQSVGRVYFEKKLIVLTDLELLTAMDPKSNRNWTCPKMNLDLVSYSDNETVISSGFTGIALPGKRYYVTYHMTSYPLQGSRQSVPNAYIQTIDGALDDYGNPMFIKTSFPANSFPFVRSDAGTLSGTAYTCQYITGLIQEFDIEDDPGILGLDPFKWRIATVFGSSKQQGSGVYMSSTLVNSISLVFTREEYDDYYKYFVMGPDTNSTGIGQQLGLDKAFWPGDMEFFFGNVTTNAIKKNYIRNVHFFLDNNSLNTTTNSTYTSGSTYITEIFLLGGDNKILGVGKPDRPIEKNASTLVDMTLKSYY